jgi:hypothetical protein
MMFVFALANSQRTFIPQLIKGSDETMSRSKRTAAIRQMKLCLEAAVAQMDEEAALNGQLAGCNAVFVVSRYRVQRQTFF